MRRIFAVTLLGVLLSAGCAEQFNASADPGWTQWSRGPFVFHVATRDVPAFGDLENRTMRAADQVGRALNRSLDGPIDVWAYFPEPPPRPDGKPAARIQSMTRRDPGAEIFLPAWPPGLLGRDASEPPSLSILHELIHVFQFQLDSTTRIPPWLLEGGATLEGLNDTTGSPSTQRAAALVMLNASRGAETFENAFQAVSYRDRDVAIHFGGALAIHAFETHCDLPSPGWVALVAGLRDGHTVGNTLREHCGRDEATLLTSWREDLQHIVESTTEARPLPPPGLVVASADTSKRAFFLDACQGGGATWTLLTDHATSKLSRDGGVSSVPLPDGFFPETLGCRKDGSVIALGQANDGGAMIAIDSEGRFGSLFAAPTPLSSMGWNRAQETGLYWSRLPTGAFVLESVEGSQVRDLDEGHGATRPAFSPDGATFYFATRDNNGNLSDWSASAVSPLAPPTHIADHIRPFFVDRHGVLWGLQRDGPTSAIWDLVPWAGATGAAQARTLVSTAFAGDGAPIIIDNDPGWHVSRLIQVDGPWR